VLDTLPQQQAILHWQAFYFIVKKLSTSLSKKLGELANSSPCSPKVLVNGIFRARIASCNVVIVVVGGVDLNPYSLCLLICQNFDTIRR
jgi:hypothetical protein